jgi:hypothetical protein
VSECSRPAAALPLFYIYEYNSINVLQHVIIVIIVTVAGVVSLRAPRVAQPPSVTLQSERSLATLFCKQLKAYPPAAI